MQRVFNERLELLPKEGVDAIKEGALEILETVGFAYRHMDALRILKEHGATVDYNKETAKLPRELILDCLKKSSKAIHR